MLESTPSVQRGEGSNSLRGIFPSRSLPISFTALLVVPCDLLLTEGITYTQAYGQKACGADMIRSLFGMSRYIMGAWKTQILIKG